VAAAPSDDEKPAEAQVDHAQEAVVEAEKIISDSNLDTSQPKADKIREAESIVSGARQDPSTPLRKVQGLDEVYPDARFDPIDNSKNEGSPSENGINIINSFINRTVFFDYFRHVAHKRFPDLHPEERVEKLTTSRPDLFNRAMDADHVLKLVTSYAIIAAALALVAKALFF